MLKRWPLNRWINIKAHQNFFSLIYSSSGHRALLKNVSNERLSSQMKKYTSAKTDELNHDALKAREIVHCNNLYFSNSKMWLRRFKMLN